MNRPRPTTALLAGCSFLTALAAAAPAAAHADHYSQSAYVALRSDGVHVELDLSPGAMVASQILSTIDTDADGSLSEAEQRAYAGAIAHDLSLEIDGRRQELAVATLDFPSVAHLASGETKISLDFTGPGARLPAGPHTLTFRNTHAPTRSTHQAHALAGTGGITIGKLTRDAVQENLTVDFTVAAAPGAAAAPEGEGPPSRSRPFVFLGLFVGASVLAGVASRRKRWQVMSVRKRIAGGASSAR